MAQITFDGAPIHTKGDLPAVGQKAPNFSLTKVDLTEVALANFAGQRVILNIFPSIDTQVCQNAVRKFNEMASSMENTTVLCVSMDLPFAQSRFCGAEGLQNVVPLSIFRHVEFGSDYGVVMVDGPFAGLLSRAIVILDENGEVKYTEQVPEIGQEPNYEAALAAL